MSAKRMLQYGDQAESWCRRQGDQVPERGTQEWTVMFERWEAFVFGTE